MNKAIVTLAIGKKYLQLWKRLCQSNWKLYADTHGYDIICIDKPLDDSERARTRSPSWQKCLVLSQEFSKQYERIIWLDTDILINPEAPCIVQNIPGEKIGAVDEYSAPTPERYRAILQQKYAFWESNGMRFIRSETPRQFYEKYGLPRAFDRVVQAGVLVLSPEHHRQVLENTYFSYEDKGSADWNYEMRPLSYECLKTDSVFWLNTKFNSIWSDYKCLHYPDLLRSVRDMLLLMHPRHPEHSLLRKCVREALADSYFLHFAGCAYEMAILRPEITLSKKE